MIATANSQTQDAPTPKASEAPAWWESGKPLTFEEATDRSEDTEEFVVAHAGEYRECVLSFEDITALLDWPTPPVPEKLRESLVEFANQTGEDFERCAAVYDWMNSAGGPEPALRISPLIVEVDRVYSGELVDGWHRLSVSRCRFDMTEGYTAVVGRFADIEPPAEVLEQYAASHNRPG